LLHVEANAELKTSDRNYILMTCSL